MAASRTLIGILSDVCSELGLEEPTSVVGSSDAITKQLLALINRQGRDLAGKHPLGWTVLQRLHTFTTSNGEDEYVLPDDYERLLIDTVWDRTNLTPIRGPLTPAQWQTIKSGLIGSGLYFARYRVVRASGSTARVFTIDPAADATTRTLAFEYLSNGWCSDSGGTTVSNNFAADTDVVLLDRDLMALGTIWRWRKAKGFNFAGDLGEYNEKLDEKIAGDTPAYAVDLAQRGDYGFLGWQNIPDSGYGS